MRLGATLALALRLWFGAFASEGKAPQHAQRMTPFFCRLAYHAALPQVCSPPFASFAMLHIPGMQEAVARTAPDGAAMMWKHPVKDCTCPRTCRCH